MKLRHTFAVLVAGFLSAHVVFASPGPPIQPGERLKYWVSWAILPGAGEITVSANPIRSDRLTITTTTSTRGLARLLLPFDAASDSIYDVATGRLLSLHERSQTRGKHVEHIVTFDYASHTALYATLGQTTARTLAMPPGEPTDLIAALLETRTWNLQPGEARDALVLFNDDFYLLTIHALRYENVTTDLGSFRTLVLEPRMEKTAPKGMFRKGSKVHVWIAQDDRHLPVKFEVEFSIGTGTATLESYQAPIPPPSANGTVGPQSGELSAGANPDKQPRASAPGSGSADPK
ncbi:MAG TPA: DUF3108 domain-containing protein [Opitutaceae bacterium]|nr:DUF3108 domain-containing protein [Opitutaceae bacterium]